MSDDTAKQLKRIADALEKMSAAAQPMSPDHRFPISEYASFDWSIVGATPKKTDRTGVTVVEWNGYTFVRRLAQSAKMGKAIIFSRNAGVSDDKAEYHTLVKFSDSMTIEELPDNVARIARKDNPPPPPQAHTTVTPPPTTTPLSSAPPVPTTTTPPASGKGGTAKTQDERERWIKEAQQSQNWLMFSTAIDRLYGKGTNAVDMVMGWFNPPPDGPEFGATSPSLYVGVATYFDGRARGMEHAAAKESALVAYQSCEQKE